MPKSFFGLHELFPAPICANNTGSLINSFFEVVFLFPLLSFTFSGAGINGKSEDLFFPSPFKCFIVTLYWFMVTFHVFIITIFFFCKQPLITIISKSQVYMLAFVIELMFLASNNFSFSSEYISDRLLHSWVILSCTFSFLSCFFFCWFYLTILF